jgi:pilus assembly protein Flp/PilA
VLVQICAFLKSIRSDEEGASFVEYALLATLIALAALAAVTAFGASVTNLYSSISSAVAAAI